jgi:hypothetical protein
MAALLAGMMVVNGERLGEYSLNVFSYLTVTCCSREPIPKAVGRVLLGRQSNNKSIEKATSSTI